MRSQVVGLGVRVGKVGVGNVGTVGTLMIFESTAFTSTTVSFSDEKRRAAVNPSLADRRTREMELNFMVNDDCGAMDVCDL